MDRRKRKQPDSASNENPRDDGALNENPIDDGASNENPIDSQPLRRFSRKEIPRAGSASNENPRDDSASNENPRDDDWKEGLDLVRIRNKAVLACLEYKRIDVKKYRLNKTIDEILKKSIKAAENAEQRCFREATCRENYQTTIHQYIQTTTCHPETMQAAEEVTSMVGDMHLSQLCPYFLEGGSQEAFLLRIWILLESLSWMDGLTRAEIWPKFEVLLLLIGANPSTIIAARQELLLQLQEQHPLHHYLNNLLRSVGSIFVPSQQPQQPRQPPEQGQQQQGEFEMELHAVIMAFLKQIP